MLHDNMTAIIEDTFESIRTLRATKGKEYARDDTDTLANFKRHAAALGLTPEQVWAVYAGKHWDAIMNFCKTGGVESEPIEGRINDLLTYLLLLKGLIVDNKREYTSAAIDTTRIST